MIQRVDLVTLVVDDQDEALEFYVDRLGFELRQDEDYENGGRWIEIAPPGAETSISVKTPAMYDEEEAHHRRALVGTSPPIAYRVDDCTRCYETLSARGGSVR